MERSSQLPETAVQNIAVIADIERQLRRRRSRVERVSEMMSGSFGSFYFIIVQMVFLSGWFLINSGGIQSIQPFDPPPFPILGLTLSIEFFFLTVFVLINQKQQIREAERWAHLDLQLSILIEQELTKSMRMLVSLCQSNADTDTPDRELAELTQPTSVSAVANELERIRDTDEGRGSNAEDART